MLENHKYEDGLLEGFITEDNEFVDRYMAYDIAEKAGKYEYLIHSAN
jgi:hypothetical protein